MTLQLAQFIDRVGTFWWTSRAGRDNAVWCGDLLTVRAALDLPEPDTSWMTDPVPRGRFLEWVEQE